MNSLIGKRAKIKRFIYTIIINVHNTCNYYSLNSLIEIIKYILYLINKFYIYYLI